MKYAVFFTKHISDFRFVYVGKFLYSIFNLSEYNTERLNYGKCESHNIYAKTREECEEKLAELILQVKVQIKAEKEKMTG